MDIFKIITNLLLIIINLEIKKKIFVLYLIIISNLQKYKLFNQIYKLIVGNKVQILKLYKIWNTMILFNKKYIYKILLINKKINNKMRIKIYNYN